MGGHIFTVFTYAHIITNNLVIGQETKSSFVTISSKHFLFLTGRARELLFCDIVHPPTSVTCQMSICNVPHAMCHMSYVNFYMSHVMCPILVFLVGQNCGAIR